MEEKGLSQKLLTNWASELCWWERFYHQHRKNRKVMLPYLKEVYRNFHDSSWYNGET